MFANTPYANTAGQNIERLIDSGGSAAISLIAASVTSPAAPTATLNVRRRDSHQRKIPAVLRTSAGAGNRTRVRADTGRLRAGRLPTTYAPGDASSSTLRRRDGNFRVGTCGPTVRYPPETTLISSLRHGRTPHLRPVWRTTSRFC